MLVASLRKRLGERKLENHKHLLSVYRYKTLLTDVVTAGLQSKYTKQSQPVPTEALLEPLASLSSTALASVPSETGGILLRCVSLSVVGTRAARRGPATAAVAPLIQSSLREVGQLLGQMWE